MKIGILHFEHSVMTSVVGPHDMFNQINSIVESFRPDLSIPAVRAHIIKTSELSSKSDYDLIIIPAMQFNKIEEVLQANGKTLEWVKDHFNHGGQIASICLGAFLLAATGLINGKPATTHWMGADLLKSMYPQIELVDDKFITEYNGIYTSGGAYSFTTLMIYLIEKFFGSDVAVLMAKVFLIHLHDSTQNSYKIFNLQHSHSNTSIRDVQKFIEKNTHHDLSINKLSHIANSSPRTFIRNFKKSTGDTPNSYIQKVRVEKAKKLLESEDISIEHIAIEVGYMDFASFRKTFKKNVGQTPSQYRKSYNRMFSGINARVG